MVLARSHLSQIFPVPQPANVLNTLRPVPSLAEPGVLPLNDGSGSEDCAFQDFHSYHTPALPLPDFSTTTGHSFAATASNSPLYFSESLSWMSFEEPSDFISPPGPSCTFIPTQLPDRVEVADINGLQPERQKARRHRVSSKKERPSSTKHTTHSNRALEESLRRQRMSKWFSKLELLLPQEEIHKFDRCSVIEASIRYIRSMEKTIAEASSLNDRQEVVKTPAIALRNEVKSSCSGSPTSTSAPELLHGDKQSLVTVSIHSEDMFVSVVSCRRDPILFTSILSLLQGHKLEIVTATMSRTEEMVMYCIHAKKPSAYDYCSAFLKGEIYNVLTTSPQRRSAAELTTLPQPL